MKYWRTATVGALFAHLGFGTVAFLVPYSLGPTEAAIAGLIIALRPTVEMFTSVPAGVSSDLFGRKLPLSLGLIGTGLIVSIIGELREPIQLGLASAALGCSSAFVVTASLGLVMDECLAGERGGALGVIVAALSAGSLIGFVSGGLLLTKLPQEAIYLVPGVLTMVVGATTLFHFPPPRNSLKIFGSRQLPTGLVRRQVWLIVNILFVLILVSSATIFLPLYAKKIQLAPDIVSISYVALASIALAGYLVGGKLSDRWARYNLMYAGLFLLLFAEASLVWGYVSGRWEIVFPFLALASVGVGAYAPSALALLGDLSPKVAYGASMGIFDFLLSLSEIIGPLATGLLVGLYGFPALALFGMGLVLLDLAILHFKPKAGTSIGSATL